MTKTTFGEDIYLRALTDKIVGESILAEYDKVAVISPRNIICGAISAAAEAAYHVAHQGRMAHFVVDDKSVESVAEEIGNFGPDAVILMFGGETPIGETKALFVKTMKALAKEDLETEVILHVRIFAAGGLDKALKEREIAGFLEDTSLYVYTVDLDRGFFVYNLLEVFEGEVEKEPLFEIPVTAEHADLLNRSLRNKKMAWVDA